jgi:hypothetical protein
MEVVPVGSMAGLCSTSSSGSSSARVLVGGSGCCYGGPKRAVGGVRAVLLPVPAAEDPRRSAFGWGSVSSRGSTRLDVRVWFSS